ncbi:MAG: phosphoribosylaminoimidazolesuccinocarboxamide synthase [Spirochaetia bacterium]|nr:phosphoribosylaminoimidazolesuccinocarboxamide synthase [Spirochaetia bacterium]
MKQGETLGEMLYEGKAKQLFAVEDEQRVLMHYKDDATAFNGEKKGSISGKGEMNNSISAMIFQLLEREGVKTHFIEKTGPRDQLCRKTRIIPLEVIIRNVTAGSMAKRFGVAEGTELSEPVYELTYKNDDLGDPPMNDYHAVALGLASWEDLEVIYRYAKQINGVLTPFFLAQGIRLIDFKLEFGWAAASSAAAAEEIVLADEISPDTCRFWDSVTGEKLDKDRFRRDLGKVEDAYHEILGRLEKASYAD